MSTRRITPVRIELVVAFVLILATVGGFALWPDGLVNNEKGVPRTGGEFSSVSWPSEGEAAVGLADGPIAASSGRSLPMGSIAKVVTALMILEDHPLNIGEQGPQYNFGYAEDLEYVQYSRRGQSALPVPVGGVLTQYQLLEGILVGSASNYADFLVREMWGGNDAFTTAASSFLQRNGLNEITMVEPTGFDRRNTATPSALITLGRLALADPVIAEIVAKASIDLPGAGYVENTNDLIADTGTLGIKTGTLNNYNLLSAKNVDIPGRGQVRVIVAVIGQPDNTGRVRESRALYEQGAKLLTR
ncbi:hypothetical protein [Acaricomes phytoseiuli]|uniref:hypothetical protein n=1 Tax=Acaricomes phytoseiuli TaxID=291968 RepID=UPI00035F72C2|nr:hypothetical protein [Acaricomes phytoseiuli]